MRVISDAWLTHPATRAVCRALTGAGHQALFVGGCVRNALLGIAVHDIDITTNARPDQVTVLCEKAGLKVVPTGIAHGTVTVISGGVAHEITTFRRDVATDGRRATVEFSDSIEQDARRRDFTMNALYATPEGRILDPLGAMPDLRARRVRFIDDADQRIKEDYLRILRYFRFHALYGDQQRGMDADALAACAANLAGLETLSRERIGAEMKKLLSAPDPAPSVAAMAQSGVLGCILPGTDARPLAILVHLEGKFSVPPDALRRLAALGGRDMGPRLRLSRAELRKLSVLQARISDMTSAAELGYRLGEAGARDVLLLRAAVLETDLDAGALRQITRGAQAVFPVKPVDLMSEYSGAALGKRLSDLETRWIASGFSLTRGELLACPGGSV